ncbi:hypothetical protein [Niallia sp. 03133]
MVKNPSYYVFRKWPFALLTSRKEDSQGGEQEIQIKYGLDKTISRAL